jgi:general secretion pathway protein J
VRQRASKGFTLLEVLVATTIFALVIMVLYAGYRLAIRSWESGERSHAAISELRLAGSFIRRHTTQAFPLAVSESRAWRLWFEGEARGLVFVTTMPTYLGQGGMYEMTLKVDAQDDGATLVVSRRLLHPDAEPGKPGVDDLARPLLENLESAQFAYFGATGEDGEESWHTSWQGRQRLPRLVRLRIDSKLVGDWPEMIFRLPTDAVRYQRSAAPGGPGQQNPQADPTLESGWILAPGLAQ